MTKAVRSIRKKKESYAAKEAKKRRLYEQKVKKWLTQNWKQFDFDKLIEYWETNRNTVANKLLYAIVRNLSYVEAGQQVNDFLVEKSLVQVSLDLSELEITATKLARLEITKILLTQSKLPNDMRYEILNRRIAQEYPTKDDVPTTKTSTIAVPAEQQTPNKGSAVYEPPKKDKNPFLWKAPTTKAK